MQTISLTGKVDFEFESISGRAGVQSDAEIARIASAYVQLLFDLARNPLFWVKLLQFGNGHWMLMLVMHHIISDGWSLENLLKELQTLYAAALEGRRSPLSELPVRYSDYALWQRCEIDSGALQASRESWRQWLDGAPAALELPIGLASSSCPILPGRPSDLHTLDSLDTSLARLKPARRSDDVHDAARRLPASVVSSHGAG